jgi:hypothetical protein
MNRILSRALAIGAAAPLTLALGMSPADAAIGNQSVHDEDGGRIVVLTCNHPLYPGGHDSDPNQVGFLGYEAHIYLKHWGNGPFADDVQKIKIAETKRHSIGGEFRNRHAHFDHVRVEMYDADETQTKIDIGTAEHRYDRTVGSNRRVTRFSDINKHNIGYIQITARWNRVGHHHNTWDDVQCAFNLTQFQQEHNHHDGPGPTTVTPPVKP